MSHLTMFAVIDGQREKLAEFSNSWGFCPLVWDALLERYRGAFPAEDGVPEYGDLGYTPKHWPALFRRHETLPLRWWEFNVICATFDRAVIEGEEQIEWLRESLIKFEDAHSVYGYANHFKAIAAKMARGFVGPFCFNATSVENLWWVQGDGEDDEGRPYDFAVDDRHWYPKLRKPLGVCGKCCEDFDERHHICGRQSAMPRQGARR